MTLSKLGFLKRKEKIIFLSQISAENGALPYVDASILNNQLTNQ